MNIKTYAVRRYNKMIYKSTLHCVTRAAVLLSLLCLSVSIIIEQTKNMQHKRIKIKIKLEIVGSKNPSKITSFLHSIYAGFKLSYVFFLWIIHCISKFYNKDEGL